MILQTSSTQPFEFVSRQLKDYLFFSIIAGICLLAVGYTIQHEIYESTFNIGTRIELIDNKAYIFSVDKNSPASLAGISTDAMLVSIDDIAIHSFADYMSALESNHSVHTILTHKNGVSSSYQVKSGVPPDLNKIFRFTLISVLFLILAFISIPSNGNPKNIRNTLLIFLFLMLGLEFSLFQIREYTSLGGGLPAWIVLSGTALCAIAGGLTLALELHILLITPKPLPWFNHHKKIILSLLYATSVYFILVLSRQYFDINLQGLAATLFSSMAWSMIDILWVGLISIILLIQYFSSRSRRSKNLLLILFAGFLPFIISTSLAEWNYLTQSPEQKWFESLEILASFSISLGFLIVIMRFDLINIGYDMQRSLVYRVISALIIFYIINNLYDYFFYKGSFIQSNILFFGISCLLAGMLWIPVAYLLQRWATNPWYAEPDNNLSSLEVVLDSVLNYNDNLRVAENIPRLINSNLQTDWTAVSICNNDQPYFQFSQQAGELVNEKQIAAGLNQFLYGCQDNLSDSKILTDNTSLFEQGATLVIPLIHNKQVYGGIAIAQNSANETVSTYSLNIFTEKLAEIVFVNKMREFATVDKVTKVLRRESIIEKLHGEFERHCKTGEELSLCLLDLDHFSKVRDEFGAKASDHVLKLTASLIQEKLRNTDFIGRYENKQFLIVFPDTAHNIALNMLETIRQNIEKNTINMIGQKPLNIEVSIGLASTRNLPQNINKSTSYQHVQKLIGEADIALYLAKETGRNRVIMAPNTQLH